MSSMEREKIPASLGLDLSIVTADIRFARILAGGDQACAVELWVLQLKTHGVVESRLLYGRVSPFDFINDRWNSPAEDHFENVHDGIFAQCARLTLYCSSQKVILLLNSLTGGFTLADACESASVSMSADFRGRFGGLKLQLPLAVRPPMHLPTRDYFRWSTNKVSPIDICSCDSASISSLIKSELFFFAGEPDRKLAGFVINLLSADTGLEFLDLDSWRIGDLELLELPGLTEQGGMLVHLNEISNGILVELERPLAGRTTSFIVSARLFNDQALVYTTSLAIM
ncbi:VPA1262 family N-terminal domain-containing protein, partial [Pseudacidovorax intermedius]|uniref:VPA1262 family N-terminal domain-containing protein n=1 Tax=Pseudacidovorax intermedius TaxID=433924 RepID=UPI0012DC8A65